MKRGAAARGLIPTAAAVAVTLALSLVIAAGSTSSVGAISRVPDSTMVGRLSGNAASNHFQATTVISDAAWLASGLLASAIDVRVNLPLIER